MTRGPGADWNRQESQLGLGVVDLGELAARITKGLSGPYRGGRVLFSTAFSASLAEIETVATTGTITYDATKADIAPGSCKLTTGALINNDQYFYRYLPGVFASKVGVELSVYPDLYDQRLSLDVEAYYADGAKDTFNLTLNILTSQVTGTIGGVALPTLPGISINRWSNVKLVCNLQAKGAPMYDRFIINDQVYDYHTQAGATGSGMGTFHPRIYVKLLHQTLIAAARTVYIGRLIFTTDEY